MSMKRLLHTCIFLLIFQFMHGQGTISSMFPDSANRGTYVTVALTGTGVNFQTATATPSVTLYSSLSPTTVFVSSSVIVNSPTQLTAQFYVPQMANPGWYWGVVDYPPYQTIPSLNIFRVPGVLPPPVQSIHISGNLARDNSPICIFGNNDVPIPFSPVKIGNFVTVLSNSSGYYEATVPQNGYVISPNPALLNGNTTCNPGYINVFGTVPGGQYNNKDFLIKTGEYSIRSYSDLLQSAGSATQVQYRITTPNSPTASGCEMVLNLNPTLIYRYSVPPPASITQNTLRWNIPPTNGIPYLVTVYDSIPASQPFNTYLKSKAYINYSPLDSYRPNDTCRAIYIITSPFDPNDKTALDPNGGILDQFVPPGDSMIDYLIRFQNVGNDTAFNIVIRDTVDADFDLGTFRMDGATHNYSVVLNGNVLEWMFPFINLVDSFTNEPLSHGWLRYSLGYPPTKPAGTAFHNSASIYFDTNAPVKTNTTETIICDLVMVGFSANANGNTVSFTDNSYLGTSWFWDFGDGSTSNQQNPTHTYASQGNYTVCLTVENACGRSETICQTNILLNADPGEKWNLSVFPNPTHDHLMLEGDIPSETTVSVRDMAGREVIPAVKYPAISNARQQISLQTLPAGVYMISIQSGKAIQQFKIVKQ